jgi:hypothetical protein
MNDLNLWKSIRHRRFYGEFTLSRDVTSKTLITMPLVLPLLLQKPAATKPFAAETWTRDCVTRRNYNHRTTSVNNTFFALVGFAQIK